MDHIKNTFNAWFGSNITHIANATGKPITLYVTGETGRLTKIEVHKEGGGIKIEYREYTSMFHVPDRGVHKLERKNTYNYMTVVKRNGSRSDDSDICKEYEVGANKSYIITDDDQIIRQKYGSSNLFEDEDGKEW